MEDVTNWRTLKTLLRCLACAAGNRINIEDIDAAYRRFASSPNGIPYDAFGFDSTFDLIAAMPDVLKIVNIDGDTYAIGLPEPYNERKLNNLDLSKEARQYDGIITGRTYRARLWEYMMKPSKKIRDHFKCKDDLFGISSNAIVDRNEILAWKVDLDELYGKYLKKRTKKLRIYTNRDLLDIAPLEIRQGYEALVEKATAYIRRTKALTSGSSSDCENSTMNKASYNVKRNKNNHKRIVVSAHPSTDEFGVDLAFKKNNADLFEAAALIFPEKPPTFEMKGEVNIKKRAWEQIYAVMRLFPDGMSVSEFTQRYSQMFHKSFDYKACGCRRLVWLLLHLPDVEVVRLPDGSPGIKLIRLPNKHPAQTYADKLTRFDQIKKSNDNSEEFSDDADYDYNPEYAPAEQSHDSIRLKCVDCLENVSGGIPIAEMVDKLKPTISLDETELTGILAKFSDTFEIKVGVDEQFYARLTKFSGGYLNSPKTKFDSTKFLVTPAASIQQMNGETTPIENNCHAFPSTSRTNVVVPLCDPIGDVFDLRTYIYCNRFTDYRISFQELKNLYQSRTNDFCELEDILEKMKDLLQYCVIDYAGHEIRRRKIFSVSSKIDRLSNLVNKMDGVMYEDSSISYLDLEVGENLEVTVSIVENCEKFFVKIVALQSQVDALRQTMNEFYNSTNISDYMVPGQLLRTNFICAAKVENTWHRVQIKDVIQDDLYSVFLLDDGRIDYVCSSNLRLLREKFVDEAVPASAIEFSLYCVQPSQSQVIGAKDQFRKLLSEAEVVSASIEEKRDKDKCASVTLFGYSGDSITEINQRLIDSGLCMSNSTTTIEIENFASVGNSPAVLQSSNSAKFSLDVFEPNPQPPVTSSLNVNAQPFALSSNANVRCQKEVVELNSDLDKTLTATGIPNITNSPVPCFNVPRPCQNAMFSQSYPDIGRPPSATTPPNFGAPLFMPMLGAPLRPPVIFPALPPGARLNFPPNSSAPQTIFVPVYVPVPFPAMQSAPPAQFYPNSFANSGHFLPAPPSQMHPAFPNNGFRNF